MKSLLAAIALLASVTCSATDLNGTGSVSINETTLSYDIAISNVDTVTSGSLRIELWAFAAPYQGGAAVNGFRVAVIDDNFNTIAPGHVQTFTEVANYPTPPNGTYYFSLIVTEYVASALDDGYAANLWWNLSPALTFGQTAPPPPPPPPPASITPQVGLWWNPNESGSGYAIDYKHGTIVMTVYSYTAAGAPQWYLAFGPLSGDTWTGTLYKFTDGQCISCAYKPEVDDGSNDGTVTVVFSSATSGTMYLPGGRVIPIEPQAF